MQRLPDRHPQGPVPSCDEIIVAKPCAVYHKNVRRRNGRFESHFLIIVNYDGMRYVCELANMLGVDMAAVGNVDKLESLRLVVRSPSKGGRRAMVVCVPAEIQWDRRPVQPALQSSHRQRLPIESCSRRQALHEGPRSANECVLKDFVGGIR